MEWWRKFGLITEPKFDVHPLLSEETERFFVRRHDVAINNKIFNNLANPASFFKKIYAILGDFGSGKTTLVNYIRYNFLANRVNAYHLDLPWHLGEEEVKSPHEIRVWFVRSMIEGLIDSCNHALNTSFSPTVKTQLDNQITNLENVKDYPKFNEIKLVDTFRTLRGSDEAPGPYDGFTIFMDELHRIPNYQFVLDFLKHEQFLFQSICACGVAIFIAGKRQWEKHLDLSDYGGIFDEVVVLSRWTSRNAYELIDSRLRDAAAVQEDFKNPLEKDSLDRVPIRPDERVPRNWIKIGKRILENTPDGVKRINAALVAQALHYVDPAKLEQIKEVMKAEYPAVLEIVNTITVFYPLEAADLLITLARLYHRSITIRLSQEDNKKIGVLDLRGTVEKLSQLNAIIRSEYSVPPVRVGKELKELQYREEWQLNEDVERFFEKIEESSDLGPESYILRLLEKEKPVEQNERVEIQNVKQLKTAVQKLQNERAKAHIRRAIQSYEHFTQSVFTRAQQTLREATMTIYNITAAFFFESSTDNAYKTQLDKDLPVMLDRLSISNDIAKTLLRLNDEYMKSEWSAMQVEKEIWPIMQNEIPQIMDQLIDQFCDWTMIAPEKRNKSEMVKATSAWKKRRPTELLMNNAVQTLRTTAREMNLTNLNEEFYKAFLSVLKDGGSDKLLAEAIDILCYPYFYGKNKSAAFKRALVLVSEAFAKTLESVGKSHRNGKIRGIFRSQGKMKVRDMVQTLFLRHHELELALNQCSAYDSEPMGRSGFEEKTRELLKKNARDIPTTCLALALAIITASRYNDENCEDTDANTDEKKFRSIVNAMLSAIVFVIKYLSDRDELVGFSFKRARSIERGKPLQGKEPEPEKNKYVSRY